MSDSEKQKLSEDGEEVINLLDALDEKNIRLLEVRKKLEDKNIQILINSGNPMDEIKNLTCPGCFKVEAEKDLIDVFKNAKEIFDQYKGYLVLDKLNYTKVMGKVQNAVINEDFTLHFKRNKCQLGYMISLPARYFKQEAIEALKDASAKFELEMKDDEL